MEEELLSTGHQDSELFTLLLLFSSSLLGVCKYTVQRTGSLITAFLVLFQKVSLSYFISLELSLSASICFTFYWNLARDVTSKGISNRISKLLSYSTTQN